MLDLPELCRQYAIEPRGIIHVGAHEGTELSTYKKMGVQRILFIEANPAVFERLQANVSDMPGIDVVACAISNQNGFVTLHVTSSDQSSSILPLKLHKKVYPQIEETHQIVVQSKKLDTLLDELKVMPNNFNILNIDIQGAELLAFEGSINLLMHIEAINTEVNFEELYEGCALIDQIDRFLDLHGFERVATTAPFDPSWGDAFYVKKAIIMKMQRQVISMSTLGRNGRFGNQIFQYAFLKIYGREHDLSIETPKWIGQYLFGHSDPSVSCQLPQMREGTHDFAESIISKSQTSFKGVDFEGYFQYHTKYYAPHKKYFRSLFQPIPEIKEKMMEALSKLRSMGKTVVGLHLRRGDYRYGPWFLAPSEWYKEWLQNSWKSLEKPILFIASDEPETVRNYFAEYKPIIATDLNAALPSAEFYPDFYLLSHCDIVAISNSSFSFAACMLNENCKLFFRPHLTTEKLITFDPWNSSVLSYEELLNIIQKISTLLLSEKFEEAHVEIERALEKYPDHSDLLKLNGELKLHKGEIKEAKEIFSGIIDRWPNHVQALNNLAVVMSYEMNFDMAINLLEKVLCIDPGSTEAMENLRFIQEAKNSIGSTHSENDL